MSINGSIKLNLGVENSGPAGCSTPSERFQSIIYNVEDGSEDDEIDLIWSDNRTLAASSSEDHDLTDGTLLNSFGVASVFDDVRLIVVRADDSNSNDVLVGGAGTNEFTSWVGAAGDQVKVRPGGVLFLYAPVSPYYAVSAGSADELRITNGGAGSDVTYCIYIGGSSA